MANLVYVMMIICSLAAPLRLRQRNQGVLEAILERGTPQERLKLLGLAIESDCGGQASEVKLEILLKGGSRGELYVDVGAPVDLCW